MNICRCTHSVFRHYDEDQGGECTACPCPEFRHLEIPDAPTAAAADSDDDWQLRNMVG